MEPTVQHRAVILVDHQRTERRHDRLFVVGSEEGDVVKRAWRAREGWQLMSDNPDKDRYPTVPGRPTRSCEVRSFGQARRCDPGRRSRGSAGNRQNPWKSRAQLPRIPSALGSTIGR